MIFIGGDEDMLDPIKEEVPENMTIDSLEMMGHGSHHMLRHISDRDKGTFWPEKPRVDHNPGNACLNIKSYCFQNYSYSGLRNRINKAHFM